MNSASVSLSPNPSNEIEAAAAPDAVLLADPVVSKQTTNNHTIMTTAISPEHAANEAFTHLVKSFGFDAVAVQRIILKEVKDTLVEAVPYASVGLDWLNKLNTMTRNFIEGGIEQYGSIEALKAELSYAWVRDGGQSGQACSDSFGLGVCLRGAALIEAKGLLADAKADYATANAA